MASATPGGGVPRVAAPAPMPTPEPMPLGHILETALSWGLPAAPVVVAMAMTLGWTPASASFGESYILYMACMTGVLLGLAPAALFERWLAARRCAACVAYAACLEAGWVVLTVSYYMTDSLAGPLVGGALDGLATAGLFTLWLAVGQTGDTRCELAKLAVASLSGFILYAMVQMLAPLKWPSFLLPVAAAVPMYLRLRDEEPPLASGRATRTGRGAVAPTVAATAVVAVLLGSCFGVLGFEATAIDSSIVIAGLVLALPLALPSSSEGAVGQVAAPLAITGLCTGLAFGLSVSFSVFLAGCACFMSWLLIGSRRVWGTRDPGRPWGAGDSGEDEDEGRGKSEGGVGVGVGVEGGVGVGPQTLPSGSLRLGALGVGFATLALMAGLTLAHALIVQGSVSVDTLGFASASLIALADFAWRMVLGRADGTSTSPNAKTIDGAGAGASVDASPSAGARPEGGAARPDGCAAVSGAESPDAPNATAPDAGLARLANTDADAEALGRACGLSARELEVARLVCANRGVTYIGAKLGLSKSTTKTHIQHIYAKANVHSRDELQLLAERCRERERGRAQGGRDGSGRDGSGKSGGD